jgi:hypothetical protein
MRMNMMGKRVNFACRSVISPDPFMMTSEGDSRGVSLLSFAKSSIQNENIDLLLDHR